MGTQMRSLSEEDILAELNNSIIDTMVLDFDEGVIQIPKIITK